ncbi:hypothetical protein RGQ29_021184 [Quercus rubra]|uniref:F-box/LRR-repeat protein 15/At3g58940/PEG3-like LRR domain-containing protein n=1 Tax=Quercus rubra TaxID=3512 RepID=A0AAN7FIF7_QUERU|nr:hypothetical protein RGQ29_021184 [Quercus rubra]
MRYEKKKKSRNTEYYAPLVSIIDALDRISQLPENSIHHILFLMPPKDAARTSSLADFTFSNTYDRYVLKEQKAKLVEETEKFIKSVDEALLTLREHKKIIQSFSLNMRLCSSIYDSCIDNWIELVNRNHIQTLDLEIRSMIFMKKYLEFSYIFYGQKYVLPQKTFSAESLVKLSLSGCKLESDYFSDNMRPICLRELTLRYMEIDTHTITKILRCCRLLEVFVLKFCMYVRSIVRRINVPIVKFPKLKKAKLYGISWISVEAPNLEVFHCEKFIGELVNGAYSKVKKLKIKSFQSKHISILDFNYIFFLKEEIKISSHGLKTLSLSCDDQIMPLLQIDCENLHSFKFDSKSIPNSFSITSSALTILSCTKSNCIISIPILFLLYLGFLMQNYFTSEELVPIVKHFVLDNVPTMKDNTAILDGLLWSCHPKVLLTYSNSKDNEFIKFLFQTLVNRDEEPNCCSDGHMKSGA